MTLYSKAARRWIEPLLLLNVGPAVALRFLAPAADSDVELGIVPAGADTYIDYPAPNSYVRELSVEELVTLAGQFRQGAREVLLSDAFAQSVASAQGLTSAKEAFEKAAGLLIGGQICRIRGIKPLEAGDEAYAWQLLCDAPLDAA
jgi:hypothetical protein